jgi:hypothetical protein
MTEHKFGNIGLRVMKGIELLDSRIETEGWRKKIHLKSLQTMSMNDCPLAQIFGTYHRGKDYLGLTEDAATKLGFQAISARDNAYFEEHTALTAKWQELVPAT